jgi:lipoyl(octanoyl) transferase
VKLVFAVSASVIDRNLGLTDYITTRYEMQKFSTKPNIHTKDEVWITEHTSVYTTGLNRHHINTPRRVDIQLVKTVRGGI